MDVNAYQAIFSSRAGLSLNISWRSRNGGNWANWVQVPSGRNLGRTKAIYQEIKPEFEIDFAPNLHRIMACDPEYHLPDGIKVKAVMFTSGTLDCLTNMIIGVAVSTIKRRRY